MQLEERTVLDLLPDMTGSAALDLGCGSGRYLRILEDRGAWPVFGLDLSRSMLLRARSLRADLVQADIQSICIRATSLKLVTCALVLGHIRDLGHILHEISRVLAPAGTVIYSELHPNGSRLGWKRTFRDEDGKEYAARSHIHSLSDHLTACKLAGLQIDAIREPVVDFEHRWKGHPALIVIRARKPIG
jgi:malonyl-CoA O-methyltransferase